MIDLVGERAELRQDLRPTPTKQCGASIFLTSRIFAHRTAKLEKSPRGEYEFTDALKAHASGGRPAARRHLLRREWADVRDVPPCWPHEPEQPLQIRRT